MANYYGSCRSNYFKVKDAEEFLRIVGDIPGIDIQKGQEAKQFVILGDCPDGGGWPGRTQDEDGEDVEINLPDIVADHLIDGAVAIFMEAGSEKLRYIVGYAEAINNKKERRIVSLQDIYQLAEELTDTPPTYAEY